MSNKQSHNGSALHCDPAKMNEIVMNRREDMELNAIADARLQDRKKLVVVNLDIGAVGKQERNAVYRAAAKR